MAPPSMKKYMPTFAKARSSLSSDRKLVVVLVVKVTVMKTASRKRVARGINSRDALPAGAGMLAWSSLRAETTRKVDTAVAAGIRNEAPVSQDPDAEGGKDHPCSAGGHSEVAGTFATTGQRRQFRDHGANGGGEHGHTDALGDVGTKMDQITWGMIISAN
jgi:hypothetical protein